MLYNKAPLLSLSQQSFVVLKKYWQNFDVFTPFRSDFHFCIFEKKAGIEVPNNTI